MAKARLGETAARRTLKRAGYEQLPSKLPGGHGIDGVFVKRGPNGSVMDIIVVESKYSSTGRASLTQTKHMGQQLSPEWVRGNINKLLSTSDASLRSTGQLLRSHESLIRVKANVLDAAGVNRWHRVKIP